MAATSATTPQVLPIDFRILGPLEAYSNGRRLEIGGGKQRSLLALLLLHAGETVSRERLVDALWGDDPPASAANSVHVYVSQLRKVFGSAILETRGHGYVLAVAPEAIDARRFEGLLRRAREKRAQNLFEEALQDLSAAQSLWHGPPLADLAYADFAQAAIARLSTLRLSAYEEQFDVQAELGWAAELVPELETLVRSHPERERLRAQLMLALYRSGRQAAALEVYRDGRRMLAEQLGLDPSPELQRLERAILTQDPELTRAPAVASSRRGRARRGALAIVAGSALALAVAIAVALVLSSDRDPGLLTVGPNSVGVIEPGTGRIVGQIPVGNTPTKIAAGAGAVWVINADDRTISQIEPTTHRLVRTVAVDARPTDIAVGEGALWVGTTEPIGLARVDPGSGVVTRRLTLAEDPFTVFDPPDVKVAVGAGSIWAGVSVEPPRSYLARVDPDTGRLVARIGPIDVGPLAVGSNAVWAIDYGMLTRVDVSTNRIVSQVSVPADLAIAADDRWVWAAQAFEDLVWRVDARGQGTQEPVQVGRGPTGIALGLGSVWVSSRNGTLSRIDPVERRVIETVRVGGVVKGVAVAAGAVWVTVG